MGMFQCPGAAPNCFNVTSLCDGNMDCPNGFDEGPLICGML